MLHITKPTLPTLLLLATMTMLTACDNDDNNDPADDSETTSPETSTPETSSVGLPSGLFLSLLDTSSGAYYLFNTDSETLTDLNEAAGASEDSSVQKLQITDTSLLGHFLHWPDFRLVDDEESLDNKYLLMKPDYTVGSTIDADQFIQLAHFHDDTLAAHSADEFADPEPGSAKAAGLERLNSFVAEQQALAAEVTDVMPDGEELCRAFVDPYLLFESSHEEDHDEEAAEDSEHEHDHDDLVHMALSTSGRMYFFTEEDTGLEQSQGFVKLDDVTSISDCNRTTIVHASDDGVLVFIPDTQKLYLVDSHGADYHQHSTWDVSAVLPEGVRADMIAVLGAGSD
ncbi:MAG: hypothetical protein KDJ38_18420, partial [Gammaproteobacteria bacterium]|nr:hypothetical protein [Gammaproteobacteria bacterium]